MVQKTNELKLSTWTPTDQFKRTEFNDNFEKIDEFAKGVKEKLDDIDKGANKTVLNNNVDSTSTTEAATANAVRLAYEKAEQAFRAGNNVKQNTVSALLSVDDSLPINVTSSWSDIVGAIDNIQTGANTSDATATATQILSGATAYVNGQKLVGTMVNRGAINQSLAINSTYTIPQGYHDGTGKVTQSLTTKAAATITPSTANQTIAANQYLTGAQTILGDVDLVAANIRSGVNIFGVLGTLTGAKVVTGSGSDVKEGGTLTVSSLDFQPDTIIIVYKTYTTNSSTVWNFGVAIYSSVLGQPSQNTATPLGPPLNIRYNRRYSESNISQSTSGITPTANGFIFGPLPNEGYNQPFNYNYIAMKG